MAKRKTKTTKTKDEALIGDILSSIGVKKSDMEIPTGDGEINAPWVVPFRHKGLQKISGGLLGGGAMLIEGESATGKSFLGYEIAASVAKMEGKALLFDTEAAYEEAYLLASGYPKGCDSLAKLKTKVVEDIRDISKKFIVEARKQLKDHSKPIVIIIDSLVPTRSLRQAENDDKEKETGFGFMNRAGVWYEAIDLLVPLCSEHSASLVLFNHMKMEKGMFSVEYKTQLKELTFRVHQRLRGRLAGTNSDDKDKLIKVSQKVKWQTVKNRYVRPLQEVVLTYGFDTGIKEYSGLLDLLVRDKLVEKKNMADPNDGRKKIKGCIVKSDEEKTFWPLNKAKEMFEAHPELLEPRFVKGEILNQNDELDEETLDD